MEISVFYGKTARAQVDGPELILFFPWVFSVTFVQGGGQLPQKREDQERK